MEHETTEAGLGKLRLAAVGDLLMACDPRGRAPCRGPEGVFDAVADIFAGCDVVLGNLECTLAGDGSSVPPEPRVVTTPGLIGALGPAGFTHLSLANNHTFDCLEAGFRNTCRLVGEMGVSCFGAGDDLAGASAPAIVEASGVRIALLGVTDERSGALQYAGEDRWGVAPLDIDRLGGQIAALAREVDHVIVTPHWGEERFLLPAPKQIAEAHAMVDAGASMVLGHHSHVIQGLEVYRDAPIIYSLGSFLANTVYWTDGDYMTWNRTERTGCILLAELTKDGVRVVEQVPTYDDTARVSVDETSFGPRRIARANRALACGVTLKRYRREHLWVKTVKPALGHLRLSRLRHLRWRHVRKAFARLLHAGKAE